MNQFKSIKTELDLLANKKQASILQKFFKTGPGEYGEGDIFLGIKMPIQRKIAQKFTKLSLPDLQKLLKSKVHEHRMTALLILIYKLKEGESAKKIFNFYLKNIRYINNWDLVDVTCPPIIGKYLLNKPRTILYKLSKSNNLWEKRISIIGTFAFIQKIDFKDTIKISKILLKDKHDLIHKAVGWMLREVGKMDESELIKFLDKYTLDMPRTMLRYAIERLPEKKRLHYLKLK